MSDLPTQLRELAQYAADGPPSPMVSDMVRVMREAADRLASLEQQVEAERTRALLLGTLKGYAAGENAPSKHWRERAEAAEAQVASLEQAQQALRDECDRLATALAEKERGLFEVLPDAKPVTTSDRNAKEGAESL